jgi:hypothetical protein
MMGLRPGGDFDDVAPPSREPSRFALEFGVLHFPEKGRNGRAVQKRPKAFNDSERKNNSLLCDHLG